MKKKIFSVFLMCAFVLPCLILLSACGGGKKVQSITVDGLFVGDYAEYQYGTSTDEIFSLENMQVTVVYTDNSTKVLNSDEYSIEFKKNSELIDEIKTVPDVGNYEINVYYNGVGQGGSFNIIPSETPYYKISLSHKAWTYGEEDIPGEEVIPVVSLANYQLQEGDSVCYYCIEKSVYDSLSEEEKRYPSPYAYWADVENGDTTLDAGQYYVFAEITFINESNHIGLTVIDDNALITVNKKTITVTPEDASGVSAWKFDYSNSYNVSLGQSDGDYLIGDLALKDIYLENNHTTISGVEGYFDWEDPEQTLNSSNNGDSYSIIFVPYSSNNYNVFYSGEITLQVSIEKGVVDNKSTLDIYFADSETETIVYDGEEHSLLLDNFEIFKAGGELINIVTFTQNGKSVVVREKKLEGGLVAYYVDGLKEVGTYTFTVSIVDKENYCWKDGTTDDATFTVEITE